MTAPDPHPDGPLLAAEGVDEGSAASTAEDAGAGAGGRSVGGLPTGGPPGDSTGASDPAPPDDMESDESRGAREAAGTGQQLEAGEG